MNSNNTTFTLQECEDWVAGLQLVTLGSSKCLKAMQTGAAFSKVYPQLGKTVIRTFTLSSDLRTIRWSPTSSGSKNSIEIASIKELRIGMFFSTYC